jgi:hypothetical protein
MTEDAVLLAASIRLLTLALTLLIDAAIWLIDELTLATDRESDSVLRATSSTLAVISRIDDELSDADIESPLTLSLTPFIEAFIWMTAEDVLLTPSACS